ncbi:CvpA family protein [Aliikangiella coralliicola]|uniref:CvpA family protein n=1 Tax=Aliikangiella coralliicola TaxID=2592383 RepID=UPI00143D03C9|nr:CvpA family protein [Aliikangiella coralliicola]
MDISLILFFAIVIIFAFRGYKAGVIVVLSRLISLPAAYVATWLFAKPFGRVLQETTAVEGFMAYMVAGGILFFVVYALLSGLFSLIHKLMTPKESGVSQISSVGGALLNGFIGIIIGVLAVWFFTTMKTLLEVKKGVEKQPTTFEQSVKQITADTMMNLMPGDKSEPSLTSAPAVLLSSPADNIQRFQRISQAGYLQKLFNNYEARRALVAKKPVALMRQSEFQNLVEDPDFIELAKAMKFSSQPQEMQKQMALQITKTWAQVEQVQNDPRFIQLTQDPEVKNMIHSRNVFQMMNSAKIESLFNIISTVEVPEITFTDFESQAQTAQEPKPTKKTTIHRWVDENGKVHYSDKKPEKDQ